MMLSPRMRWFLYNLLFPVGYLLMLPVFLLRMRRRGGYRPHFMHRFARYEPELRARLAAHPHVWIHAVSVGEAQVALQLMDAVRMLRPQVRFLLTTTTSTGYTIAAARLAAHDALAYFPLDFPPVVRRALDTIRPAALLLTEGELWPNLIRLAHARRIPLALVNARVSDHSFPGYRRLGWFIRPTVAAFDQIFAQSPQDADRLRQLGGRPDRISVAGTAKFDSVPPAGIVRATSRAELFSTSFPPEAVVLLGGSTWPGEERILIDIFRSLRRHHPMLRLVLVPRHAERRDAIRAELATTGLVFRLRSETPTPTAGTALDVLVADTTGELLKFYAGADIVFVGKSLTAQGGQNMIEPAMFSRPVIVGPHTGNFRDVMTRFLAAGAIRQVRDANELAAVIAQLLQDPAEAAALGARAEGVVAEQRGAAARTAQALLPLLNGESDRA